MILLITGILATIGAAFLLGRDWVMRTVVAVVLGGCVAVYGWLGEPETVDQPLADRLAMLRKLDPRMMDNNQRLAMLQEIARQQPDDPQAHYFIGDIMLQSGRPEEAVQAFQSSLRRDPQYTPAMRGLADSLVRLDGGRVTPQTAQIYGEVLRADPENVQAAFMIGMGAWLDGEHDLARRVWAEAGARMPEGSAAREELAMLTAQLQAAMANVGKATPDDEDTPEPE